MLAALTVLPLGTARLCLFRSPSVLPLAPCSLGPHVFGWAYSSDFIFESCCKWHCLKVFYLRLFVHCWHTEVQLISTDRSFILLFC